MIWIIEKKVTHHLLMRDKLLAEVPLRISFEYGVESGVVVDGSLSIKVIYNSRSVNNRFPEIKEDAFNVEVEKTANDAVREHLVLGGLEVTGDAVESVVIAAH